MIIAITKIYMRALSMKLSEMYMLSIVFILVSTSLFNTYNLLEKEKMIMSIQKTHQMICFINSDFIAKCQSDYFFSKHNQEEWLLFIKNYFSLDEIELKESLKNNKCLYALKFSLHDENYLINYVGSLNEKNKVYE